MTDERRKFIGLVILAVGVITLSLLMRFRSTDAEDAQVSRPEAPALVAPLDHAAFVESDIRLRWNWTDQLASDQIFAVRVWYEDQPPIEVWTRERTLDVQTLIDSFSQQVGFFYWQVAVIQYSEQNGYEKTISEWSPVYSLQRVSRLSPTPYPTDQQ